MVMERSGGTVMPSGATSSRQVSRNGEATKLDGSAMRPLDE